MKYLYLLISLLFIVSCTSNNDENKDIQLSVEPEFRFASWAHGAKECDSIVWKEKLKEYASLGISELIISGSVEFLSDLVILARKENIQIHAWIWTLNRPGDTVAQKHPDWYAVNRIGQNSLDYRAYVNYYQWLSPFHPGAREHVKNNIRKLTKVNGLASIHLDYVRYVDVILGADLQPKYGLVQDHEMPEYDYDYHPLAREGFKEIFGIDPIELTYPELSTEWRQYRLNAITSLVNEIAVIAHESGTMLTAAVFPFPEMSRQMVRQAWNDWNLDAAFPMIYHNFYRESINWIGFATQQGVNDVDFPVYSGLFTSALKDSRDFEEAIRISKKNGATGVCFFMADNLDEKRKTILKKLSAEFNTRSLINAKIDQRKLINVFLDQWHLDAANADFGPYMDAMTDISVFIGTDASENWTKKEFADFCKPIFNNGSAWEFKAQERNIYISEDGQTAWFDELLDTWMGICRGSGVLVKQKDKWKVKHYVLSVTVPNEKIREVIEVIQK